MVRLMRYAGASALLLAVASAAYQVDTEDECSEELTSTTSYPVSITSSYPVSTGTPDDEDECSEELTSTTAYPVSTAKITSTSTSSYPVSTGTSGDEDDCVSINTDIDPGIFQLLTIL